MKVLWIFATTVEDKTLRYEAATSLLPEEGVEVTHVAENLIDLANKIKKDFKKSPNPFHPYLRLPLGLKFEPPYETVLPDSVKISSSSIKCRGLGEDEIEQFLETFKYE